jgi:hypothetical protein
VLGSAGLNHREKLTIVADKDLEPFADWIEQLIAESSGKDEKGLTPIVGEAPGSAKVYGDDRLMIYLREGGELDRKMRGWIRAGIPVAVIEMTADAAGFGRAFFKWEVGTAVACHMIGVNAFDQPDVQSAKNRTGDLLTEYEKSSAFPQSNLLWEGDGWRLYGGSSGSDLGTAEDVIAEILDEAATYGMLGILTYLRQDAPTSNKISKLRKSMRDRLGIPRHPTRYPSFVNRCAIVLESPQFLDSGRDTCTRPVSYTRADRIRRSICSLPLRRKRTSRSRERHTPLAPSSVHKL